MRLMPENISSFGGEIDSLIFFISVIAIAVLILAEIVLLGFLLFRRKPGQKAPYVKGVGWRQLRWVLLPVLGVVVLDFLIDIRTHKAWNAVMRSLPEDGLHVRVTGRQYQWAFTYPGPDGMLGNSDDFTRMGDFPVPVNRNVIFDLEASDVVHSFWVPALRFKQDAVPGRTIRRWFNALKTGSYDIACAELCGTGHSLMKATLRVLTPEEFEREMEAGVAATAAAPPAGGMAAQGHALSQQKGCVACHSVDGAKGVGPTWKGLFGRRTRLADGREIKVDAEYLLRSLRDPAADLVEGFPPGLMPKLPLTAGEEEALVEYLKTLR